MVILHDDRHVGDDGEKGVHRNNKLEHDKDVDLNHLTLAGGKNVLTGILKMTNIYSEWLFTPTSKLFGLFPGW